MNGISVFESRFGMDQKVENLYNILIEIDEYLSQHDINY